MFRRGVKWDGPPSHQEAAEIALRKKRAVTIKEHQIQFHERDWKGNFVVPFNISDKFDEEGVRKIEEVMQEIEKNTCIRFEKHSPSCGRKSLPIQFKTDGSGECFSRYDRQEHVIMLGKNKSSNCIYIPTIYHEILHSLGVHHEQRRPDRDEYVTVYEDNIEDGQRSQFDKVLDADTHDTPYDFHSVMHYRKDGFGKNGSITIKTHDPYYQDKIGKVEAPSISDYQAVCHQPQFDKLLDADTHGTPYDFDSVMHYRKDEFGKNGAITIETHDPDYQDKIGKSKAPSIIDYQAVCNLYKCKACMEWKYELPQTSIEQSFDSRELDTCMGKWKFGLLVVMSGVLFMKQRLEITPNVHEVFRRGVKWDGPQPPPSHEEAAEMAQRKKRAVTIKEHEIKFHERGFEMIVVVPYNISDEFLEKEVREIEQVMEDFHFYSCIDKPTIYHEILHSLGVHHEHERPDRDKYVTIYHDNIENDTKHAFEKLSDDAADTHGTPYDFYSLMHYRKNSFGINEAITIQTHDPRYQDVIGNAIAPSELDYQAVCNLYKCDICMGKRGFELPESLVDDPLDARGRR
ncbi:unnamed protein product [Nippostrongylus brasiliensis]|uniref:Metalloendopeptidase n=1 Tax=Nippostrongylus brasiliensis TaxID=27835 RepID=A0A0N4YGF9_NIPBR|nr:unnamed protein product [Nippostrongylus brasiliensis]